jgi:hypothetical protein
MMVVREAGMGRRIVAVVAAIVLAFSGGVSAAASPASSGTTAATSSAEAKACNAAKKKAKKLNKRFKKLMKTQGSSLQQVMNANNRYNEARNRAAAICRLVPPKPDPQPQTFSGNPRDPRPKDWVRPVDGSGLPGSNFEKVQVAPNCPVTISKIEMKEIILASGGLTWVVNLFGENYSPNKMNVHFTADVINGRDGSNWNAVPSRGWIGKTRMVDRERELYAWEEWGFSSVLLKASTDSFGTLDPVLLGATLTCLD